ncbi:MAG: DUF1579 domain-containing protein [Phycisphaerales bacterium]|nr:DUF1579 domain-containing protein [Phycisphaerales bacterium]
MLATLAGSALAAQPIVRETTQEQLDAEMAEMQAIAQRRAAQPAATATPSQPLQFTTPSQLASPQAATATPADQPASGSMLGDTVSRIASQMLRKRQASLASGPGTTSPEVDAVVSTNVRTDEGTIALPTPTVERQTPMTRASVEGIAITQQEQTASADTARQQRFRLRQTTPARPTMPGEPLFRPESTPTDQAAANEPWRALAEPGRNHRLLEIFVGTWTVEGRFPGAEGQPPEIATGTMTTTWELGSRWLTQRYEGSMPSIGNFEGLGLMGFDNAQQRFVASWMDTLSTGAVNSTGTFDQRTRAFTLTGRLNLPNASAPISQRQTITVESRNRYIIELAIVQPDGTSIPTGTVTYTRAGDHNAAAQGAEGMDGHGVRRFTNTGETPETP